MNTLHAGLSALSAITKKPSPLVEIKRIEI